MDHFKLDDSNELYEVIRDRSVNGLLTGHTHYPSVGKFGNTIAATAPGVVAVLRPKLAERPAHPGRLRLQHDQHPRAQTWQSTR